MLRILLWKIGIEWAHLLRALSPQTENTVYYFAFGANLAPAVLAERRIRILDAFDYELDNAALRFSQSGFYRDHGYASADAAEGECVYGRVYRILARDAVRMDYFEGVPFFGAHEKVYRQTGRFEFFFYRTTRIVDGLRPTREYLDYLIEAYRQMPGVPPDYVRRIAATEILERELPLDRTGLFVRDIDRWPAALHPLLVVYERCCAKMLEIIWHRSLTQFLIRR